MKFISKMTAFMAAFYAYMIGNESFANAIYEKLKALYTAFGQYKTTVSERFVTVDNAITGAIQTASNYTDSEISKLSALIKRGFNGFKKFQLKAGTIYDLNKAINNGEITFKEGQWRLDFTILDDDDKPTTLGEAEISIEDNGTQVLHKVSSDEKLIIEVDEKGVITVIGIDDNEVDVLTAKVEETGRLYEEFTVDLQTQKDALKQLQTKVEALTV